jgi:hypothetical protein
MHQESMQPISFHFHIGGYCGESHEVEFKGGKLRYRRAEGAYVWGPIAELTVGDDDWNRFWRALETAGVWQWKGRYENLDVLDGTQWSLKIKRRDRNVECSGSNAYPGSDTPDYSPTGEFGCFIQAVRNLTGKDIW